MLSNIVNYVQYAMNPGDYYNLEDRVLEQKKIIGKYMIG